MWILNGSTIPLPNTNAGPSVNADNLEIPVAVYCCRLKPGMEYTIGRKNCDIVTPEDKSVSRKHGTFSVSNITPEMVANVSLFPTLKYTDHNSSFGSFCQGKKIDAVEMKDGDMLSLGAGQTKFVLSRSKICITLSGMTRSLKESLAATASRNDLKILGDVTSECTHLIVTSLKVTMKVVWAVAFRKFIVSEKWLAALDAQKDTDFAIPDEEKLFTGFREIIHECQGSAIDCSSFTTRSQFTDAMSKFDKHIFVAAADNSPVTKILDSIKVLYTSKDTVVYAILHCDLDRFLSEGALGLGCGGSQVAQQPPSPASGDVIQASVTASVQEMRAKPTSNQSQAIMIDGDEEAPFPKPRTSKGLLDKRPADSQEPFFSQPKPRPVQPQRASKAFPADDDDSTSAPLPTPKTRAQQPQRASRAFPVDEEETPLPTPKARAQPQRVSKAFPVDNEEDSAPLPTPKSRAQPQRASLAFPVDDDDAFSIPLRPSKSRGQVQTKSIATSSKAAGNDGKQDNDDDMDEFQAVKVSGAGSRREKEKEVSKGKGKETVVINLDDDDFTVPKPPARGRKTAAAVPAVSNDVVMIDAEEEEDEPLVRKGRGKAAVTASSTVSKGKAKEVEQAVEEPAAAAAEESVSRRTRGKTSPVKVAEKPAVVSAGSSKRTRGGAAAREETTTTSKARGKASQKHKLDDIEQDIVIAEEPVVKSISMKRRLPDADEAGIEEEEEEEKETKENRRRSDTGAGVGVGVVPRGVVVTVSANKNKRVKVSDDGDRNEAERDDGGANGDGDEEGEEREGGGGTGKSGSKSKAGGLKIGKTIVVEMEGLVVAPQQRRVNANAQGNRRVGGSSSNEINFKRFKKSVVPRLNRLPVALDN
ncbi:hypothetical protein HDU76_002070 [Blyttiomyces sp. JEL0837]|nr:hypothetical protein HDU76_002070 [Blyttiomyces sp. JEL0837]